MNTVTADDMNYLAQQSSGRLHMILAGMTALMNDMNAKTSAMESQNWFQRMVKTVTGRNKLTLEEIQQNHDKLNAYMSEAIAELYSRNCITQEVLMSLGTQINELYADHIQLKQMLGAFANKLNEKIDSVDNFHMLVTEIDHGLYSSASPLVAVCKVMSQFDNRILDDDRKLEIIKQSLTAQGLLNNEQLELSKYLWYILEVPVEEIGQIYLELGTIRNNFMANVILSMVESYYFLPDLARKMKSKESLIKEILQEEKLDASVLLSIAEIYEDFLSSKIDVKNGLVPVVEDKHFKEEMAASNSRDDIETTQLGIEALEEEDYSKAVKYFKIAAENGYADAQNRLGLCYYYGDRIEKNESEAFKWWMKAAEQGYMNAQCNVGICYAKGEGIEKNGSEAFKWCMKAAEQGYMKAQYNVGVCYYNGDGIEKNESEAFKWFMKVAEQGHMKAQFNVGVCYHNGKGIEKNESEAFKFCRFYQPFFCFYIIFFNRYMKAAEQGYMEAQCNVGVCYHKGYGIEKNESEAFKWYMKAAEQNDSLAQYYVGKFYYNGRVIEKNDVKAKEWLIKSAKQGKKLAKDFLRSYYSIEIV